MVVTFLPINKKIDVNTGDNLYHTAIEAGISLGASCGGKKTCGKCKVLITKGNHTPLLPEEIKTLSEEEIKKGIRLACCVNIEEDICVVLIGASIGVSKSSEKKTLSAKEMEVKKEEKKVEKADEKREKKTEKETGEETGEKIKGEQKWTSGIEYGIAIDIGTTTVVGCLWDITNKKPLATKSRPNPQSLYGKDVISRITYGSEREENLNKLTYLIRNCCNELIKTLSYSQRISVKQIEKAVIAANTTMTQLFCGNSVEGLRKVPIHNISYEEVCYFPYEVGLAISEKGSIYVMPGIGGHVGSDTLAGIIALNLLRTKETSLLIDIGTNGEIALVHKGRVRVCSTSAGPAFEGAVLHQGMTAASGAITEIRMEEDRFYLQYIDSHIQDVKPVGICGSGALEAVYELLIHGKMDDTGRLLGKYGEDNYVTLYKDREKSVRLTQKDIREIQLAKGAIYAGCMTLLKEAGISMEEIDGVYIAGAFGSHLDVKKALRIGLIPHVDKDKVRCCGNTSLEGAGSVLLTNQDEKNMKALAEEIIHVDLALIPSFEEEFIDAMSF